MKNFSKLVLVLFVLTIIADFCQITSKALGGNIFKTDLVSTNVVYYFINKKNVNSYLSTSNSSSGQNIYQNSLDFLKIQKFKLVLSTTVNGVEYYNIIPYNNTSLRLDVENAADANGANIKLFSDNPTYASAQRFRFILNSDNTYSIMPQLSTTRVIEAVNGASSNGTNIQLYDNVGAEQQKWVLKREIIHNVGSTSVNSNYDRTSAVTYAKTYGASPNFTDYPDTELNCTNFVSQCIHSGGINMKPTPVLPLITDRENVNYWFCKKLLGKFWTSEMWSTTGGFYNHWIDSSFRVYRKIEFHTGKDALENFDYLCSFLDKGDVIQYADNEDIAHSMFIYEKNQCDGKHKNVTGTCKNPNDIELLYAQNTYAASGNYIKGHLYWLLEHYSQNRFIFYKISA